MLLQNKTVMPIKALISQVHPQWEDLLAQALDQMDSHYLATLTEQQNWLPGIQALFAAFSLPLQETRYILMGESPYPRPDSANGYAFWDNAVQGLWSSSGLSKEVNRATSLRNWIKMLLLARGDLDCPSQAAIAALDKTPYWKTGEQLFTAMIKKGFLLLNASLVYREGEVPFHARQWQPFMQTMLNALANETQPIELILLGNIAKKIPPSKLPCFIAEHPYNLSFVTNPEVLDYFRPLDLLKKVS